MFYVYIAAFYNKFSPANNEQTKRLYTHITTHTYTISFSYTSLTPSALISCRQFRAALAPWHKRPHRLEHHGYSG